MLKGRRPVGKSHIVSLDFGVPYTEATVKRLGLKHKTHRGIDFDCDLGTPCEAYRDGVIQMAGEEESYGRRVWLYCDVPNEAKAVRVLYAHLSKINVVPGQRVKEGQLIGLSGNTGKSTGPHLHFEVRELPEDKPIRPLFYLERGI